jgi:hypothetical protein
MQTDSLRFRIVDKMFACPYAMEWPKNFQLQFRSRS